MFMPMLRIVAVVIWMTALMAQDDNPALVVANARSALAAGAPERVILAAGTDDAARARLARLATAMQAGRFDLTPREQRVLDDCAAVVVEGSRPRSGRPDLFALYLVREDGAWRLLPDPTRPQIQFQSQAQAADPARATRLATLASWVAERISLQPVALAGEALATWMLGNATVAEHPVRPGAAISLGQRIVLTSGKPGRIVLNHLAGSSITCAPGTVLSLVEERADSGTDLIIDLEEGAVQVDVLARGPYAHVRVRGLVSDVTVVGTIFLVQRVAKDRDYVAQVEGTVHVKPKAGAASVELTGRQGVTVGLVDLDRVDLLLTRPQLTPERLAQGDLRIQGLTPNPAGGGWDQDPIRDQSPRVVTAEEQAAAQAKAAQASASKADTEDSAAPPTRSDSASTASTDSAAAADATRDKASSKANQIGVINPGFGSGLTISPAAALSGSSGGSAGGVSPGASPAPISGHPGFPSP